MGKKPKYDLVLFILLMVLGFMPMLQGWLHIFPTKPLNAKACIVKVDITKDSVATTPFPVDIKRCVPYLHP